MSNHVLFSPEIDEDYDRISYDQIEFQPRFSPSEEVEDFGFNTNSQSDAVEGFGKDDLFLDHSDTRDRNSNDYQDIPGNVKMNEHSIHAECVSQKKMD